jgi:GNAT superfamily N-acetyltransferase
MFQIVRAQAQDSATLKKIAIAAKSYWDYPDELIAQWAQTPIITPESIAADPVFKACTGDSEIGWYRLLNCPGAVILEDLWLLPAYIGKGIGRALFEHAVDQARRSGAQNIELDADPNAAPFYTKMGCRVIGETLSEWGRTIPRMRYSLTDSGS